MKHPNATRNRKPGWLRMLRFHIRNFISGRYSRCMFNISARLRAMSRWRRASREDPRWKDQWWLLERRYTILAKKYVKLELRYMLARDELRRIREHEQAQPNRP